MGRHRRQNGPKKTTIGADAARAEAKKARRVARQIEELKAMRAERRNRRIRKVAYGALGILGAGALIFLLARPDSELTGVERPPNDGRSHVVQASYSTATPTSGAHSSGAARCGVFSQSLPLDNAVHALEHGVVVVWYSPDIPDAERQGLVDMVDRWDSHVIVSPNAGLSDPIVATAWNRLMRFDSVGDDLVEFVDVYRQRGPEQVRCDI